MQSDEILLLSLSKKVECEDLINNTKTRRKQNKLIRTVPNTE